MLAARTWVLGLSRTNRGKELDHTQPLLTFSFITSSLRGKYCHFYPHLNFKKIKLREENESQRCTASKSLREYDIELLPIDTNKLFHPCILVDGDNEAGGYLKINAIIIQNKKGVKEVF